MGRTKKILRVSAHTTPGQTVTFPRLTGQKRPKREQFCIRALVSHRLGPYPPLASRPSVFPFMELSIKGCPSTRDNESDRCACKGKKIHHVST